MVVDTGGAEVPSEARKLASPVSSAVWGLILLLTFQLSAVGSPTIQWSIFFSFDTICLFFLGKAGALCIETWYGIAPENHGRPRASPGAAGKPGHFRRPMHQSCDLDTWLGAEQHSRRDRSESKRFGL